jgi:chaperonin cofactor prefoldin
MKETINLRIQDLMSKGRELEQQIQQINGALQQCQWQLEQIDIAEKSAEEVAPE